MNAYSLDIPFRMPWIFPVVIFGLGLVFIAHAFWITWNERDDN